MVQNFREFLRFGMTVLIFIAPAAYSQPRELTLNEAIQYAIENSLIARTADVNLRVRELEYRNSYSKLLPSLDLSSTNGLQNNIPINGNYSLITPNSSAPWFSLLSLSLTETIYDNGATLTQISIANKQQDLATLNQSKARAQITLDIASEFFQYSRHSAWVNVRQRQLEILKKQFDFLSAQYRQGLKPRLDYLRFKAQVQKAEIDRNTAEKNKEISEINLNRLIGVQIREDKPFKFKPIETSNRITTESVLPKQDPKLENVYDFKISILQKEINDERISFVRRKYWPQVNFGAGVTYSNMNYLNSSSPFSAGNQLSYSALVNIQFNFLDWGIRKRDIEIAELNRDIQENELNLNLIETKAKMNSLMTSVVQIRKNYNLSKELLDSEEQNYRNIELNYKEGKSTYLDLITALTGLLEAKIQFYSVFFEMLQADAQYQYYEGSIYEKLSKLSY